MLSAPKIVSPAPRAAAVVHFTIPRSEIESAMDAAIQEVLEAISSQGKTPAGPLFAHHLTQSASQFDCEVGFPVDGGITAVGRVKPGTLPGATAVMATCTGEYDGLFDAWREFGRVCRSLLPDEGYVHGPTLWEIYTRGPESETNPEQWQTELYQSIERGG